MTNDIKGDATSTTETSTVVDMEIAGPPVRQRDATNTRTRRRLVILCAAIVTVGMLWVLLGAPFDDPSNPTTPGGQPSPSRVANTPSPSATQALDELPQGRPPAVPYLKGGRLHLDDASVPTIANRLLASAGTVLVGRSGKDDARWWVLDGVDLVLLPDLDGAFTPVLSPRGDLVAWTSWPDEQTTRISVLDTTSRTEVDSVDLDAAFAECCGGGQEVEIHGIDGRDQVYFSDRHGDHVWRPRAGTPPQRLSGSDNVLQVAPLGPVRQGGALGRVDARGHWSKIADLPTDQGMVWSADGALAAYGGDDTGSVRFKQSSTDLWVSEPGGTRTHLGVPVGVRGEVVAFEFDDAVLVDAFVRPRRHYLLRCSVSDGTCQRTLPTGRPTWTFPEPSFF